MSKPSPAPDTCANCGADIPPGARACPECGADERTGWRETDNYDGIDLPDEAWTDSSASENPHASRRPKSRDGIAWYWRVVAVIAVLLLLKVFIGLWR